MLIARTKPISPSKAYSFYSCKLRFLAETEQTTLPKTPVGMAALLGTVTHMVIDRYLAKAHHNFEEVVHDLRVMLKNIILSTSSTASAVAYVLDKFGDGDVVTYGQIGQAARYVDRVLREFVKKQPTGQRFSHHNTCPDFIGSEKKLDSASLQIAGKPDLTYFSEDNTLIVVDFKTGRITTEDGINLNYLFQVACYGAILQELTGISNIQLRLIGSDADYNAPLSADLLHQVKYFSETVKRELPLHIAFDANQLATLGESCQSCSVRPGCSAYLKAMTSSGMEEKQFVSPFDAAGQVVEISGDGELLTIQLEDVTGLLKQIRNIPSSLLKQSIKVGHFVAMFNLNTQESSARSKAFVNYFIIDTEKPQNSAFQSYIHVLQ